MSLYPYEVPNSIKVIYDTYALENRELTLFEKDVWVVMDEQ